MNQLKTPSRPSSARFPPIWAGRTDLVDEMDFALKGSGNDPALVSVFVGGSRRRQDSASLALRKYGRRERLGVRQGNILS